MKYDFETLVDRRRAGALKWDLMRQAQPNAPEDAVPLSVADMEFVIAPEIRAALHQYIDAQIPGYSGAPEGFRESVCSFLRRRHGVSVSPEELVQTPGVVYALPRAIRAMTEEGEGIILLTPVYYPFYRVIRDTGRTAVPCPLRYEEGRYSIDFALLETLASRRENKALLLCSPHNPVGRVWTACEVRAMAEIAERYGLFVIADEIHFDLVVPGHTHTSFGTLEGEIAGRTILCTAPSKTFNLAGMNLSNIIIRDRALRERFCRELRVDATPSLNPFGYVACQAAYDRAEPWLKALLAYLDGNRRFVQEFIVRELPQLHAVALEGTYLQWVDCRGLGLERDALEAHMTAHGLFFDEGYLFGQEGAGFERINLACPRRVLVQAMERLRAACRA